MIPSFLTLFDIAITCHADGSPNEFECAFSLRNQRLGFFMLDLFGYQISACF